MVILLAVSNMLGLIPQSVKDGSRKLQSFFAGQLSWVIMVGVGVVYVSIADVLAVLTISNFIMVFFVILGAMAGAALMGWLMGFFPVEAVITAALCMSNSGGAGDVAAHMVMPVLVLSVSMAGTNIRYIRSAVLEILQQDYLRTARAKGIGRQSVIYKHALRNALVPIVTVIGMQIPVLFGGAVIVEQLFSWPGLGLMTMSAILNRDYPVIMGVCLLSAVVVLLANLVTDIVYAVVNPAIQYD